MKIGKKLKKRLEQGVLIFLIIEGMNRPLNVRPKILTLRRSVFLWQNIA